MENVLPFPCASSSGNTRKLGNLGALIVNILTTARKPPRQHYESSSARHAHDGHYPSWTDADGAPSHRIFEVHDNDGGRIRVDCGNRTYSTGSEYRPDRGPNDPAWSDHSLQSLALLNEVISIAKISGTLPASQPVQVLP